MSWNCMWYCKERYGRESGRGNSREREGCLRVKMNASDDEGIVVNISDESKGKPSDGITDDGDLDWLNVSDDSKGNPSDGTTDDRDLDW